ncbi:hypothetical protein MTO96_030754 [Rhipicephalus appendiculatus]
MGLPERQGKIRDLSRFDAQFFNTHPKQAHVMDPQLRMLLETSYEAIVDAGYDPDTLRKRKIGVFVGNSSSESGMVFLKDEKKMDGYFLLGCSRAMFSNRISYSLDVQGPSMTIDTACSSTMVALNEAVLALRSGRCEAAIVGAGNLNLDPHIALNFKKPGRALGGRQVQSLRQKWDPLPVGHRTRAAPPGATYAEANVDPRKVEYVETHGTGTKVGGPQELEAISNALCPPGRENTLKVGSVKSNMGHAESACAIPSVAKIILAMETGTIAANLHFKEPRPDIPSLHDGRVEVVDKPTPFNGGLVGISTLGIGATNAHGIFEPNKGPHVDTLPRDKPEIPRLVLMAGRSEESLLRTLDRLEAEGYPDSAYALLNRVGQPSVNRFPCRGFAIVPVDNSGREVVKAVREAPSKKRPLWFVFTSMGCQWNGMARQMMHFDIFSRSIRKSHALLQENFGIDLIDLVTSDIPRSQTMVSPFLAIAAIQVALVDMLHALGLEPDGIVGHSVGEVGCAYADGGLTAEQALLSAYWRGRCTELSNPPKGSMAVVIPQPKPRSKRWISSSLPESRWHEPAAKLCSAEYHTNNFVNPVLFREALEYAPKDAILLEIGPHCLLQAILRRVVGPEASCLGLMKRNADNLENFLGSLGKLHTLGVQIGRVGSLPSGSMARATRHPEHRTFGQLGPLAVLDRRRLERFLCGDTGV